MIKKNNAHRFISILTALVLSFSGLMMFNPLLAHAASDTNKEYYNEALIEELSVIEPVKENYGLNGVDFCELYTSEQIPVYEYTKDGIEKTGQVLPVYYQGHMKLIMFEVENNKYQAVAIPKDISVDIDYLAIIYDDSGCHFYNGKTSIQLFISNTKEEKRNCITSLSKTDKKRINLSKQNKIRKIKYKPKNRSASVTLSISFITQPRNTEICWAAVSAMIVNYKKNTNYTATEIALMHKLIGWNDGLSADKVAIFLNNTFNLGYKYYSDAASMNQICININNGNPVYGSFYYFRNYDNKGYHAALIYGYNMMYNSVYIADPQSGFTTGQYLNSRVTYLRPTNGYTYHFYQKQTVCKNG